LEHIETTFIRKRFPSIFRFEVVKLQKSLKHIKAMALKSIKVNDFIAHRVSFSAVQQSFSPDAFSLSPGASSNCRCNIN
jgi:hypothetical protein